jgi:hypothetical protein
MIQGARCHLNEISSQHERYFRAETKKAQLTGSQMA